MEYKGRRQSSNVDDARGRKMSGSGLPIGLIIQAVTRMFGVKGILILGVVGVIGWQLGVFDPATLLGGGGQVTEVEFEASPEEEKLVEFVGVVLADTEDVWTREFQRIGRQYQAPTLVLFRQQTPTGCGVGDARSGPFYCPADRKIYIDLSFYNSLEQEFRAPGDFAQAYVIAHEVGHHVQKLLGISDQVAAKRGQADYNEYSVRLELQADFLSGLWAHHNQRYLEQGDIEEAMRAANQIGDDAIQSRTQGKITPHAFTHGSSEQRMRWFNSGLKSGRIEDADTFKMPYSSL